MKAVRQFHNCRTASSGAGGSRTLVQTSDRCAFYMLIPRLIVGECTGHGHPRHPVASKISPQARGRPFGYPVLMSTSVSPTDGRGRWEMSCPRICARIKLTYYTSVRQQERSYSRQLCFCIGFQGC